MNQFSLASPKPSPSADNPRAGIGIAAPFPAGPHVRIIAVTNSNGKERKLFVPASLDLDRPKRPRTTFTPKQLQILKLEFTQNRFVTDTRRRALALVLKLTETQIKVWFQNRRTKQRRMQMQMQQWPQRQNEPARVQEERSPAKTAYEMWFTKSEVSLPPGSQTGSNYGKEFVYSHPLPLFNNGEGHFVTSNGI